MGNVHHPKMHTKGPNKYTHRIGETIISKYGEKLEITGYNGCGDCTVKFEDGSEMEHVTYRTFKKGALRSKQRYIGLEGISRQGLKMTIVGYRTSSDIDVEFENGVVVHSKHLGSFRDGRIKCPVNGISHTNLIKKRNQYIGQKTVNAQGIEMTVKDYNGYADITVEFEDGEIKEHVSYDSFRKGSLRHPNYSKISHIGEQYMIRAGLLATIIKGETSKDMAVELNDGTIRTHVSYSCIKTGKIGHPKYRKCKKLFDCNNESFYECLCKKCKGKHILKLSEMKDFECKQEKI